MANKKKVSKKNQQNFNAPKLNVKIVGIFVILFTLVATVMLAYSNAAPRNKATIWVTESPPYKVGQQIHFEHSSKYSSTDGSGPWIQLLCYRAGEDYQYEGQISGTLILSDSHAGFAGGYKYGQPFTLSGTAWHEGPADCEGMLYHRNNANKAMTEAKTYFHVE